MKQELMSLKHIGLQFFAEGGEGGDDGSQGNSGGGEGGQQNTQGNQSNQQQEGKSYTQEQLNSMMANEKRTARQALLKELGLEYKDDEGFKTQMSNIKKTLDAGKTQQQLDAEAKKAAEAARDEANAKATQLEMKVAALSAGVNPDYLDDIITLAVPKVTEEKPIAKVLEELKTKYPTMFGEVQKNTGTGGSTRGSARKSTEEEGLGARLAKAHKTSGGKSSYFKN